jgi:hypothetical protein
MATETNTTPAEKGVADSRLLEVSFGKPIPQPRQKKGEFVAFGELAGSASDAPPVDGQRSTTFGDSVAANERNI